MKPKICLCLTEKTLAANLRLVERYRRDIDLVELRVDCLSDDECYYVRKFPQRAQIPAILTIRRKIDGGEWSHGEAARTTLFARALAFSETSPAKNFAYVDFEEDVDIPCLQDAAMSFGTRIIRSTHVFNDEKMAIRKRIANLKRTGLEIPKVAILPHDLNATLEIYNDARKLDKGDYIISPMGVYGQPLRVLSSKINSYLIYTSTKTGGMANSNIAQIDIDTILNILKPDRINDETQLFAITGNPLTHTRSPAFHNNEFLKHGINSFYFSLPAKNIEESLNFANHLGIKGMSITAPFKETVVPHLKVKSQFVNAMNSCNTIIKRNDKWYGYNTDLPGILTALTKFLNRKSLFGMKVAIIGAGGVAKSFAEAVKILRGNACIFNRHIGKARDIAVKHGFKAAALNDYDTSLLKKYNH
ncbi:MAG: type I 3-dehydroquinate dehydratase, partial [Spirochaetaceae bacterium]|nr:type I 3-dehydroquinate dehydratase [Spirochaetaceae bacterium]